MVRADMVTTARAAYCRRCNDGLEAGTLLDSQPSQAPMHPAGKHPPPPPPPAGQSIDICEQELLHSTRFRDSLKLNANMLLTCFPPNSSRIRRLPFVCYLDSRTADVELREDAGMGTPRCEIQTFSNALCPSL